MECTELRIGNLVLDRHGDLYAIHDRSFAMFRHPTMDGNPSGLKPIALTEEMLLKCGFTKVNGWDDCVFYQNKDVDLQLLNGKFLNFADNEVKYLHQLQNLFFAIMQEEFEVNL